MKTEKKIPERSRSVLGRFYCIRACLMVQKKEKLYEYFIEKGHVLFSLKLALARLHKLKTHFVCPLSIIHNNIGLSEELLFHTDNISS